MLQPTVTGYYRYTDIWFDWHSKLPNPEDGSVLKAILAHDALAHPKHPLHVEGDQGARLYQGTFKTGEARLLFSSAQVDYVRYWLHAMGMTKEVIPLPWSDCLLTSSDLETVTPVIYPDGGAIRGALKVIDKNNKKLKGAGFEKTLTHRRLVFERARSLWAAKKGIWCAIDFEAWEMDHEEITEFGYRFVGWKDGSKVEECGHWIVENAMQYTNSRYVQGNRDWYQFGQSEKIRRKVFDQRIRDLLVTLRSYGPVYLVFHDPYGDLKYLNQVGAELGTDVSHVLPDAVPSGGILIIDTAELLHGLMGESGGNSRSLEKMCNLLRVPASFFHNGGNDAHYTLSCLIEMAGGDPLDIQRETRWPNRSKGLWVPDVSDDEDDGDDLYP